MPEAQDTHTMPTDPELALACTQAIAATTLAFRAKDRVAAAWVMMGLWGTIADDGNGAYQDVSPEEALAELLAHHDREDV